MTSTDAAASGTQAAPYLGPRPFERVDSSVFFGREGEILELLSLVVAHRVVLLYAASGAGKTSLLNAGLVPALEAESFEVLPVVRLRGARTAASVENVYSSAAVAGWDVEGEPDERAPFVAALGARPHPVDAEGFPAPRAVVFDQFEELFSLYPERWHDRAAFLSEISAALEQDPLLRVVLALREDYVAQLDAHSALLPGGLRDRFRLEPLRAEAALHAIALPLEGTDRSFAPGVAEQLVSDLRTFRSYTDTGEAVDVEGEFVEPVQLQVVCQSLWEELPPDVTEITEEHLRRFGDVNEVLVRFYDDTVAAAGAAAGVKEARLRRLVEEAFLTPGGTRGTAYRGTDSTGDIPNAAVDELENRHLIRAEWRAGARWYELTHDRLVGPVRVSNEAFAAARTRRRIRRLALVAVVALVLAAAAALTVLLSAGRESAAPPSAAPSCPDCKARLSAVSLAPRVTRRQYLQHIGAPIAGYAPASLRETGVLFTYRAELINARNRRIQILWTMVRLPTNVVVSRNNGSTVLTPRTAVDAHELFLWARTPKAGGTYQLQVQAVAAGQPPLATTTSPTFTGLGGEGFTINVRLRIRVVGNGVLEVGSQSCTRICAATVGFGTPVTLRAVPAPGSRFVRWIPSQLCSNRTPICTIVGGPVTSMGATFTRR
jgi:hypothetical protein